jgi:hypothetical protein
MLKSPELFSQLMYFIRDTFLKRETGSFVVLFIIFSMNLFQVSRVTGFATKCGESWTCAQFLCFKLLL